MGFFLSWKNSSHWGSYNNWLLPLSNLNTFDEWDLRIYTSGFVYESERKSVFVPQYNVYCQFVYCNHMWPHILNIYGHLISVDALDSSPTSLILPFTLLSAAQRVLEPLIEPWAGSDSVGFIHKHNLFSAYHKTSRHFVTRCVCVYWWTPCLHIAG